MNDFEKNFDPRKAVMQSEGDMEGVIRPKEFEDFSGQEKILKNLKVFVKAAKQRGESLDHVLFHGPPGLGKTTLANIIAENTNANFVKLNAVTAGVADAKKVIEEAKSLLRMYGKQSYLLLDECHRWNKAQSDSMLEAIEKGYIIFIGATTENPYMSMTRAIVSRCRVFEFKPLSKNDILTLHTQKAYDLFKEQDQSGAAIVLDVHSGEILTFVSAPSFEVGNRCKS